MIDFNNVKIIKKLNTGIYGTTYLCDYKKKQYALKIQHILSTKKDYNNEMWREIDVFKYIDTLTKNEQLFFTKLYGYRIYDNCKHKQIRTFKLTGQQIEKFKKLDESNLCVEFLLEYKGKHTLRDFLLKKKYTYSIILQIINIILILHKGGYSHNDLHYENIMIYKTKKEYFIMNGHKINYNGYQVSAIDYGRVLHKKYKIKYEGFIENFLTDNKKWLLEEIFNTIIPIITNYFTNPCIHLNKKYINDTLNIIFKNHLDIYNQEIIKYIKMFPKGIYNLNIDEKNKFYYYAVNNRFIYEFELKYPKLFKKYFNCITFWILSKNECLDFLLFDNPNDYITFFINKIELQ